MRPLGWGGLAVFWTAILLAAAAGAAALQSLGPVASAGGLPPATAVALRADPPAAAPPPAAASATVSASATPVPVPAGLPPGRTTAGPIDDPDPALLEPAKAANGAMLPRLDPSGRGPMQAYARGFDRTTLRPRVGLILAGIGVNEADSQDAIRTLPGAITLAMSPYTQRPKPLLDAARITGHEMLLWLPMESGGDSANDAGDHALLTTLTAAQNADRLDWLLSRFSGYAGVTDAFGRLRGERFATQPDRFTPVLRALAGRGLFFVDARPDAMLPSWLWGARVDVVIDEPAVRSEIDAKLTQLEALARQRGWALGLAGTPRPVTTDRIADWTNSLSSRGFVLAPASALARQQPEKPPDKPGATIAGASK